MQKLNLFIILLAFFFLGAAAQPSEQASLVSAKTKPNRAPIIKSITPPNNSTFLAGIKIEMIKIEAFDPDKNRLEYQFSFGGEIKQAWSVGHCYTWQTSAADTGDISITCEVRDNKGAIASRTITYHVINPTVEEVLQKVKNNYAKIFDLKADTILSSTLNGESLGKKLYCRYYFKAPTQDSPKLKEKTEFFLDSSRTIKTKAKIIDGAKMHKLDILHKNRDEVSLLELSGLNSSQFSQLDLGNLTGFLDGHTVTKNGQDTDFNKQIIALDALPKTPNNLYTKLEFYVDFRTGLIRRTCIFKENAQGNLEFIQSTEVTGAKQMPNGTWIPTVMQKTPNVTAGKLVTTLKYIKPQINTGLNDSEFDPAKQY